MSRFCLSGYAVGNLLGFITSSRHATAWPIQAKIVAFGVVSEFASTGKTMLAALIDGLSVRYNGPASLRAGQKGPMSFTCLFLNGAKFEFLVGKICRAGDCDESMTRPDGCAEFAARRKETFVTAQ